MVWDWRHRPLPQRVGAIAPLALQLPPVISAVRVANSAGTD